MTVLSQSTATINAIVNLAKDQGYDATPFETDYKSVLTKDDQTQVVNFIAQGLMDGNISMTEKSQAKFEGDPKALRRYVVGLVNDRLRKAKAINGNVTYVAKNPGKLTNSRDAELKALTQVLTLDNTAEVKAEIEAEIARRKSELAADKVKTVTINYDALPADLRAKLGI